MQTTPVVVAVPIADRRASLAFYSKLGFEPFGPLAEDGIPEPLQFALNDGCHLMLVPKGGFGWITGDHAVAEPGTSECLLSLGAGDEAEVGAIVERARAAGATVVEEPNRKPWAYLGTFADPDGHLWMVTAD
jgi:predicted lactoylglutathione lyase